MAEGSARVVYAALAGNMAIAAAKFVAYGLSGSSAMLTEAVHSMVDSTDQILMLVGQARGRKPPSPDHPFGYGMETYFWSFVVALMVFLLGGVASILQGVRHLLAEEPVTSPGIGLAVLAIAAVFEASTFAVGFREYKRVARGRVRGLWRFIRISKDPSLYATLLEDFAALIGIGLAAAGILASSLFHVLWADGAASIAIGLLLTAVAAVLANETRSLIAGESVAPPVMVELNKVLQADDRIIELVEVATLHLGPQSILVALTLSFRSDMTLADLRDAITELTGALQKADGRVCHVYVRPAPDEPAVSEAPGARSGPQQKAPAE
jgi:cation diffusion facilitator family transporter